ncbi:MAG: hypothetical protein GKR89_34425 [Candidatus Latescibacteria bacterium]|nr:hypothetical protein [Candidatus Latescibacterota bacterium]
MDAVLGHLSSSGQQLAALLLNTCWQSLLLVVAVGALLRVRRRTNAATRYAVWGVTLMAVFGLPLAQLAGAGKEAGRPVLRPTAAVASTLITQAPGALLLDGDYQVKMSVSRAVEKDWAQEQIEIPRSWGAVWLAVWAGGTALLLARLVLGYRYTRRLKKTSAPLPLALRRRLRQCQRQAGVGRGVDLGVSSGIASPMAVGLAPPAILFPQHLYGRLSSAEIDQVFLHELAHIRRWDDWANLAQRVVEAVLWCLPAVWWIGRRLDLEREIACDDWVVAATGQWRSYATCLTRLVEWRGAATRPLLASGAVLRRSHITQRITLLLDRRRNRATRLSRPGLAGFVVLLLVGAGWLNACSNPFAPVRRDPVEPQQVVLEATTPDIAMRNLRLAMSTGDRGLYETLLDDDFWFTEFDCLGEQVFANNREEELAIIGRRDGSSGIFNRYRTFDFEFDQISRTTELAINYPDAFPGDPDGHPDEDWEVVRGRVVMRLLDIAGDGFLVDQLMTFKMRQSQEGLWKIIRWDDDPLSGDCRVAKTGTDRASWMAVKAGGAQRL